MIRLLSLRGVRTRLLLVVVGALAVALGLATIGFNVLLAHAASRDANTLLRSRASSELALIRVSKASIRVAETREPCIIRRRGGRDVALIAADELSALEETAHLLRSPKNARRLLSSIARGKRRRAPAMSVEELRRKVCLDREK